MRADPRVLAGAALAVAAAAMAGCGGSATPAASHLATPAASQPLRVMPESVKALEELMEGGIERGGRLREVADPEESRSYPVTGAFDHAAASTPASAGEAVVAHGALSEAEVRAELALLQAAEDTNTKALLTTPVAGGQSIGGDGTLPIPQNVPEVVKKVIAGANEIADFPYVYGGGHATFVDNAYDCSGSVSYALAAGGLISSPEVSGELEHWGVPGAGRYITVYADAGHVFMDVDGVLYDTAGRSGTYASRWLVGTTSLKGYVVRHWPGL